MKRTLLALVAVLGLVSPVIAQQAGYTNWANMHVAFQHADFTDANASGLQNIPGLTFALPANQAATYKIDCEIYLSQTTAAADNIGIQFSVAPTSAIAGGIAATNATAFASIAAPTITSTSATNIVTFTPAVATVLVAHVWSTVEIPAGAADTIVNMSIGQGTAANVVVIKRGSSCQYHSMN